MLIKFLPSFRLERCLVQNTKLFSAHQIFVRKIFVELIYRIAGKFGEFDEKLEAKLQSLENKLHEKMDNIEKSCKNIRNRS